MEKLREWSKNPLYVGIIAGLLGFFLGWFVMGWWLSPVEWVNADAKDLRAELRPDYLRMVIDSYAKNQDAALAKTRYDRLGSYGPTLLNDIIANPGKTFPDDANKFKAAVGAGGQVVQPTTAPGQPTKPAVTQAATQAPATDNNSSSLLTILLCVVVAVLVGALAYVFLVRNNKARGSLAIFGGKKPVEKQAMTPTPEGVEAPVAQFMTTYKLGVDLYDDSFSIDSPTGEFLGECGVGISKHIGVGDPKKVTAFEVWLFDKNDIQTVTKVLMSDNAFNDPATMQELKAKGEPVLIAPGAEVYLQTATLQLAARVVDMNYGQGALPQNSFFDRLTLELAIWPKPAQ
jgi:hypothetical protein